MYDEGAPMVFKLNIFHTSLKSACLQKYSLIIYQLNLPIIEKNMYLYFNEEMTTVQALLIEN